MRNKRRSTILLLVLTFIVLSLFVTNYIPGTYLTGWDNLQTELNPKAGISRAFHGVWQEYQSFGLVAGMAHASDLVRAVFIWLFSLIMPVSLIRYFMFFLLYWIGGVGVFFLLRHLGFKKENEVLALVGGMFYMLNLGTVQIMHLPYEPFMFFFAFLPWEILVFLKYLYEEDRKNYLSSLITLLFVNFLSTPQAHTQALFVVYGFMLSIISLNFLFREQNFAAVKKIFVAGLVIICANLFWILPQVYFLFDNPQVFADAKINQIATDVVASQNYAKGTLENFSRLEGFYLDLFSANGADIFGEWSAFVKSPYMRILNSVVFVVILIGLFRKGERHSHFTLVFLAFSFMFLQKLPPFSYVAELLYQVPLFSEIFRSSFTKFVIPMALMFSVLLAYGLDNISALMSRFEAFSETRLRLVLLTVLTGGVIFALSKEGFEGELLARELKAPIPAQYHQLIKYMEEKPVSSRMALLPVSYFWGWYNHDWGYEGSGFIWYGVDQPVVSRTFDVWSSSSESFFWELKNAFESRDSELMAKILEKYNVSYLVLDYSVTPLPSSGTKLDHEMIEDVLAAVPNLSVEKNFKELTVYKYSGDKGSVSYHSGMLNKVGPGYYVTNYDRAYRDLGMYISSDDPDVYYPAMSLMTESSPESRDWSISELFDRVSVSFNVEDIDLNEYELVTPENNEVAYKIFDGEEISDFTQEVKAEVKDGHVELSFPKVVVRDFEIYPTDIYDCSKIHGEISHTYEDRNLFLTTDNNAVACFGYGLPFLPHWSGYLVTVKSQNIEGDSLYFYILGSNDEVKTEALLGDVSQFILKPGYYFNDGYIFSFQNRSYGDVSINKLDKIEVSLFPYDYIKDIYLVKKSITQDGLKDSFGASNEVVYERINPSKYSVTLPDSGSGVITLWQGYDKGWKAFCGTRICDLEHVKINNWANGWIFDAEKMEKSTISIIFWPQYLEYVGFLCLAVLFPTLFFKFFRAKKHS